MDGGSVDVSWCRRRPLPMAGAPCLLELSPAHSRRAEVEAFIAARYLEAYGARVTRFMPTLFALVEADGAIAAAAGLRCGAEGPLFVEHYLDAPAEALLGARFGQSVERARLAEIGHLCGLGAGNGRRLFPQLACWMQQHAIDWALFAATATLRQMFAHMQLHPLPLAPADGARLGAAALEWGRYYDTDPWVVGGPLSLGRALLEPGR